MTNVQETPSPSSSPKTVAIVTGSTANPFLANNVQSVNRLDVPGGVVVKHIVVADGREYASKTKEIICRFPSECPNIKRSLVVLPDNTGGTGYLCHRIIAASAFIVNADYMCVLDEDNEVEPCHVICHLNAIGPHGWSFTLRKIIDHASTVLCLDTCESMGNIRPTCLASHDRLIDTNCYMFSVDLARQLAPLWMVKARDPNALEADRRICQTLLTHQPAGGSTREFSVRYRTDVRQGGGGSVSADFFRRGNTKVPPWHASNRDVYLFHFDHVQTTEIVSSSVKNPLDEWCPTMFEDVRQVNWINGFECLHALPYDAVCLVTLCHPSTVPLDLLRKLKQETHTDLRVILITSEGPNLRHKDQWQTAWLRDHADVVLTYAKPLLDDPGIKTVFLPHNARFLSKERIASVLRDNNGPNTGTASMVLENRDTRGTYEVAGAPARSLDFMRAKVATEFGPTLTVVGAGWRSFCDSERAAGRVPPMLGYDVPRMIDPMKPMDTYQDHDFAIIIENCGGPGAKGYVSEKFGDALIAGAIPVYWGENVDDETAPLLARGRGVWWIDIRDALSNGVADVDGVDACDGLGAHLSRFLLNVPRQEIIRMKEEVVRRREEYLLGVGTLAVAKAINQALYIVD